MILLAYLPTYTDHAPKSSEKEYICTASLSVHLDKSLITLGKLYTRLTWLMEGLYSLRCDLLVAVALHTFFFHSHINASSTCGPGQVTGLQYAMPPPSPCNIPPPGDTYPACGALCWTLLSNTSGLLTKTRNNI